MHQSSNSQFVSLFYVQFDILDGADDKEPSDRQDNNIEMKHLALHEPLLIFQFTKRFEQYSNTSTSSKKTWRENSNIKHEQKRQLQMLCFTSESFYRTIVKIIMAMMNVSQH